MKKNFYPSKKNWFVLFLFFAFSFQLSAQNVHIYASPNGSTTGNGDVASAPVNMTRARAIARANPSKACIIYLASGVYSTLTLDVTDTRAAAYPVVYTSMVTNGAVFQPEITLSTASFQPIPASIQSRIINTTAKTKVMQMSLASMPLSDTTLWAPTFALNKMKAPKFYKNGLPLQMSRYPADTTMAMGAVLVKGSSGSVPGGKFKFRDRRAVYWQSAVYDGGLYFVGNWQTPWQIDVIKTQSIGTADSTITQAMGISGGLGTLAPSRIASGTEPYYAVNLVEEIAAEGQWSYNFQSKMLYMWVPASGTLTCAGNSKTPAISLTGTNNTSFVGIAIRGGAGNGIELHNCNNVLIAGSHISYCSGYGITITDGYNCTVQSNDIDSVGAGGVIISSSTFAADQLLLKSSAHKVINNHIYSYAREVVIYSAAVDVVNAIGTYVAYNKVHDSPHVGIAYGGNNNLFEYNEVYDVVKQYTDMGAFYTWGSTDVWRRRGNILRHNYIHDAPKAVGIYEDNYSSGDSTIYNVYGNVQYGFFCHWGYFNSYSNSIVTNAVYPVTTMAEPTTDAYYAANLLSLKTIWNTSSTYQKAYPELVDLVGPAGRNDSYTSRIWPRVFGCAFAGNPGVLSNVNDHKLFSDAGPTNADYAQTGPAFTTWGTVFQNNFKMFYTMTTPTVPYSLDTLRAVGAFEKTYGQDWHINRIGLHKDLYRTDISSVSIKGIVPKLVLTDSSTSKFKNPGVVILTTGIRFPNAPNILSSVRFYDNGKAMTTVSVTKKFVANDSVAYILNWTSPPAGYHNIVMQGNDGDGTAWQYTSNAVGFVITDSTKTAASANDSTAAALKGTPDGLTTDSVAAAVKARAVTDSLQANATGQMSLFPNPARNLINVSYTSPKAQGNSQVLVYDLIGRVLTSKTFVIQEGANQLSLPLDNLADGIYLLVIQSPNSPAVSQRFVVQH